MFEQYCYYYETPFEKIFDIKNAWEEIKNQNIVSLSYNILVQNANECVVEFLIDYGDEICSAVNHIKLNENKKCYYLKQWYMSDYINIKS